MGRVLAHGLGDVEWPGAVRLLRSLPFLQDGLERPPGRPRYLIKNSVGLPPGNSPWLLPQTELFWGFCSGCFLISSGISWNNTLQCLRFLSVDLGLPPLDYIKSSVAFHHCCHDLDLVVHTGHGLIEILAMLQGRSMSQPCPKCPLGHILGPSPNIPHWRMNYSALYLLPYLHIQIFLRNSAGQGTVSWHEVKIRPRSTEEPGDFGGLLLPHRVDSASVHPSRGRRLAQPALWERSTFCRNGTIICGY